MLHAALSVLFVLISLVPSPPPVPGSYDRGNHYHNQSKYAENKADAVMVVLAEEHHTMARQIHQPTEAEEEQPAEERIAKYTRYQAIAAIVLVVVTVLTAVVLGFYTYFTWKQVKATQRSANAAKKSADVAEDSLHSLERAHLFVEMIEPQWDSQDYGLFITRPTTYNAPRVMYCLRNYGRGPAIVRGRNDVFRRLDPLPDNPRFQFSDEPVEPGHMVSDVIEYVVVAPGDKSGPCGVILHGRPAIELRAKIGGGFPDHLHVYGTVTYEDIFGVIHETNYCFRLLGTADGRIIFFPAGGPAYHKRT